MGEKELKQKTAATSSGGRKKPAKGAFNAFKMTLASAMALIMTLSLTFTVACGGKDNSKPANIKEAPTNVLSDKPVSNDTLLLNSVNPDDPALKEALENEYSYEYSGKTVVGYHAEVIGTYDRVKPVEGMQAAEFSKGSYPKYGSTLSLTTEQKTELILLNRKLTANGTWVDASKSTTGSYDKMDENGYLYKKDGTKPGNGVPEQLYKHTASVGMYGGNVSDSEPAVVKKFTIRPRSYGSYYSVTGLYAPAGEVIKIQLSGADMNATGGLTIHIGQALYNGQANNIWEQRGVNRMPVILNTMNITKETATYDANTDLWTGYVGSFLGGPIYVRSESPTFSVTISGGVNYQHFILGVTSKEEYEEYKKSSAPYFDLEVWDRGVLHSGPKRKVQNYSYDDLYKAAILWEKISLVSTTNGTNQGIVFLYDPFVAAGAAVAFPGRRSVNCPEGWITGSLNYNAFVSSGSWGNVHEYNHNFQNYGLGSGADGEVTNNGLNLVSYALFTKITSKRGIGSYGAAGLGGGWNNYTSATWALERVKNGQITSTNGLAIYATLLHNFGADAYIRARGSSGKNNYLNKWASVTHNDFTYYASLIGAYGGGNYTPSAAVKNANYPMFVPVSCVYQTGRSYMYDGQKKYFNTMRPYVIAHAPFDIDLSPYNAPGGQYAGGSIVIPDGFTYKVKSVTKPANGSIEITDDFNIRYIPAENAKTGSTSGQIVVTLEIVKNDGAFKVEDVDLILEFEISQEVNKMTLERTTYTYTNSTMYTDAVQAYNAKFAGYANVEKQNQSNPTQNANTDIWFYPNTEANHTKYPNAPDKYFFHENNVEVVDGKLYFEEDSTYRVYLRGRDNCALYYSADGKNYSLGARITKETPVTIDSKTKKANSALFRPGASETYFDVKFEEGKVYVKKGSDANFPDEPIYTIAPNSKNQIENWLYIKEVLIVEPEARSYIGVGMRQWSETMFTMQETYHKADNTAVESPDDEEYAYTKTTYRDYNGSEVAYSRRDKGSETTQYFKKDGNNFVASTESEIATLTAFRMIEPVVTDSTQPYVNAYRASYNFPDNSAFVSDYFYTRTYNYNYVAAPVEYSTWDEGVKIVSSNKQPWDDNTTIDNILKSGMDTYFHSATAANYTTGPMILELDMGKKISANSVTFLGRTPNAANTSQQAMVKEFSLEISMDGVNYTSAGSYTNSNIQNDRQVTVSLNGAYEFRYIRITINSTHSSNRHFILSGITFTYNFKLTGNGANHISPNHENLIFTDTKNGKGTWNSVSAISCFSRIMVGNKGDVVKFDFTGTRIAILTPVGYENNFEVYVDGKKVESIQVTPLTGDYGITYLSEKLTSGKHRVEVRCTGKTAIDSFAFYNEG